MKEMKTKEEILNEFNPTYYDKEDLTQPEYSIDSVLLAMDEYASQFRQEWIPVEERVPKCMDDVDVTIQFSTGELITKTDCYDSVMNNWQKYGSSVIAWKPKCQPYNPTKS